MLGIQNTEGEVKKKFKTYLILTRQTGQRNFVRENKKVQETFATKRSDSDFFTGTTKKVGIIFWGRQDISTKNLLMRR